MRVGPSRDEDPVQCNQLMPKPELEKLPDNLSAERRGETVEEVTQPGNQTVRIPDVFRHTESICKDSADLLEAPSPSSICSWDGLRKVAVQIVAPPLRIEPRNPGLWHREQVQPRRTQPQPIHQVPDNTFLSARTQQQRWFWHSVAPECAAAFGRTRAIH